MPRLAATILDVLDRHLVDTVFGIPGNHNIELYRYLPDHNIRHVTARHEQGAGFMADGYARLSGRVGVCFLISGPGVTNAMTAMAQALADSVPMLIIATVGEQKNAEGRLHELPDQLALAKGVCVEAVQAVSPGEALTWIDQALDAHLHSRPGPRFIQIPLSWWQQEAPLPTPVAIPEHVPGPEAMTRAVDLVEEAQRPLILLGGGAKDARTEVVALATLLGAPVINTVNAKGVIPPTHPLAVGASPSLPAVQNLIGAADLIIAVGTELGETDYDLLMTGEMTWQTPMLRIDIDPRQARMNANPAATVIGDAAIVLGALSADLGVIPREPWTDLSVTRREISQHPHMHPQFAAFFNTIDRACPDAVVVGDSTRPTYYASWMWERPEPRRYWHSVSGYGTLGYALPAALGAQLAAPQASVIALVGDGGMMFTLAELAVAVQEKLPVKIIIWDNSGYQEIAHSMAARDIDTTTTQYQSPDFAGIARGFGAVVDEPENGTALAAALAKKAAGPHVICVAEHLFVSEDSGEWY